MGEEGSHRDEPGGIKAEDSQKKASSERDQSYHTIEENPECLGAFINNIALLFMI